VASDTRDRLVRSTSRLLRTQGYAATGLNQVMAEADAPKGSMYFHFPGGKVELAAAAVDHFAERVTRRMDRYLADHDTVREAVTAIFDAYVEHLDQTGYTEGCAVATVALDAAGTLASALEAEGRSPGHAHALATLIIATIEGTIVMAKGEHSTEPIATTRDLLNTLLDPATLTAA
jgi:TetR/AcrR family transcriptional repressor of lmrAB and yxaGH operons